MRNFLQLRGRLVIAFLLPLLLVTCSDATAQMGFTPNGMGDGMDMGDMMGGMMGGMGSEFSAPTPLQTAVDSLKQAQTEPQRKQRLAEVRAELSAQYDSFLALNDAELKEMEQRLENLRVQLKRRVDAKDELVDLELKRISNEARGLSWPAGQGNKNQGKGRGSVGGFRDKYGDGMGMGMMSAPPVRGKLTARDRDQWLRKLVSEQAKMPTPDVLKDPPARTTGYGKTEKLNDLRQIVLACLNYEATNERFPSNIVAVDGTPRLSWRVAILPYLGKYAENLYTKFRLDEPWDSDHNKALLAKMPPVFKSLKGSGTTTTFLGFDFKGAVLEQGMKVGFGSISDGSANTLLCIEVSEDLAVEWTKPSDISYNVFGTRDPEELFMPEDGKGLLAMCDGSTHAVDLKKVRSDLKKLIQRNDGQVVNILSSSSSEPE